MSEEDRARTILMEVVAEPYNREVRGLWRRRRRSDGRPGSITEYILKEKLPFTPLTRLGRKVVLNPNCGKAHSGGSHVPLPAARQADATGTAAAGRPRGARRCASQPNDRGADPSTARRNCRTVTDVETEQHLAFGGDR